MMTKKPEWKNQNVTNPLWNILKKLEKNLRKKIVKTINDNKKRRIEKLKCHKHSVEYSEKI